MTKTAVIYSNGSQECERMKFLLEKIGEDLHEYFLNRDFDSKAFYSEFGEEATYPQISIGYEHIGNMNETLKYMSSRGMLSE